MDTIAVNHINGWSLLRSGMSGEAFSTALRHAATLPLSKCIEAEAIYSLSGQPLDAEDETAAVALVIQIERVR